MSIENLREVYQNAIDWLKFIEAKILALLTLESGFFYLVFSMDSFQKMNCIKIIYCLLNIVSIGLLVWGVFPRTSNNTNNPLYYQSWLHNNLMSSVIDKNSYAEQLQAIVKIIDRKTKLLKSSLFIFSVTTVFLILIYVVK